MAKIGAPGAFFALCEGIRGTTLLIFSHCVNTARDLARVPPEYGVEVDVRDCDGRLRLAHDPFVSGEDADDFLAGYRHAGIIFNTRCDGLESRILRLVEKHCIRNFFILTTASPTLGRLVRDSRRRTAVRYSKNEPVESALQFAGLAEWVWVHCLGRVPFEAEAYAALRRHFRICLVSPELQSHDRRSIAIWRHLLRNMPIDAVCTDYPGEWAARERTTFESEAA